MRSLLSFFFLFFTFEVNFMTEFDKKLEIVQRMNVRFTMILNRELRLTVESVF